MSRLWVRARAGERVVCGRLDGDVVHVVHGSLLDDRVETGEVLPLSRLVLLAPVQPTKVVGIGSNYREHALEMGKPIPAEPKIFLMPSTAVGDPEGLVQIPPGTRQLDHEAELAVVIGRRCHRVSVQDALGVVLGYTAANDLTCRDFQKSDGVFTRAKGFDGFLPLGPALATELDPSDLALRCWVDGQLRQDGRTSDMVFDVPTLISFVSHVMTLLPGDVISTGTPSGVGPLVDGQVVEVELEGVGLLRSRLQDRDDREP